MKKYNATFSLEDKMRESKASKVDWLSLLFITSRQLMFLLIGWLLRQQDQLPSIVMSMSVCVSVCPWGYLLNHMCDVYRIFYACCLCLWLSPPLACWR